MSDRTKFYLIRFFTTWATFFLEALFAKMLWNGVGRTLLHLPPISFWQMCGLTLLVVLILPSHRLLGALLERAVFTKDGKQK